VQRYGAYKCEKSAILLLKIDFFRTLNRHIFGLPCCIFNVFAVLGSLLDNLFKKFTGMFLAPVYFFGAKVGTSFSRQNVTISKNKKHTIFRNVKLYPVMKFRDIPN
jgi:hypothetical protein